jgi:hypothetical protein
MGTCSFPGRYRVTGIRVTLSSVLSTDNGRSTMNHGYFSLTKLYCCRRTAPLAGNTVTIAQMLPLPNLKIIDCLQENISSLLDSLQNKVVPVLELRVPFGPQSKNSVAKFSDLPGSYSFVWCSIILCVTVYAFRIRVSAVLLKRTLQERIFSYCRLTVFITETMRRRTFQLHLRCERKPQTFFAVWLLALQK